MTETTIPLGWEFFDPLMDRHGKTKIANNTYLSREETEDGRLLYHVTLHDTVILTFDRTRLTVRLDSGGFRTPLTMRRMNSYLVVHRLAIVSANGVWTVLREDGAQRWLFVDGLEVQL